MSYQTEQKKRLNYYIFKMSQMAIVQVESKISKIVNHQRGLTVDWSWQKRELESLKIDQWRLCNLKNTEEKKNK